MDNHYLPHTDLIQKAINLSEQTLFDIKRVAYATLFNYKEIMIL